MTYPKPGEIVLYDRDGESVYTEECDHISIRDRYVCLHPVVNPLDSDEPRVPGKMYVPWRRVHAIRRDGTDDGPTEPAHD